jgi:hypothetical protein
MSYLASSQLLYQSTLDVEDRRFVWSLISVSMSADK